MVGMASLHIVVGAGALVAAYLAVQLISSGYEYLEAVMAGLALDGQIQAAQMRAQIAGLVALNAGWINMVDGVRRLEVALLMEIEDLKNGGTGNMKPGQDPDHYWEKLVLQRRLASLLRTAHNPFGIRRLRT
jgi:hypothetical protein